LIVPRILQPVIYAVAALVGAVIFDCPPQAWYFGDTCFHSRWRLLLCSPSCCRLFPLELAAHRESAVIWSMARI
jgi:hypothetical protein